jgi:hypothetical protein
MVPWKGVAINLRNRDKLALEGGPQKPPSKPDRPDRINLKEPKPTRYWIGDKLSARLSATNFDRNEWGSARVSLGKNGKGNELERIGFKDGRIAEFSNCQLDSNLNGDCIDK